MTIQQTSFCTFKLKFKGGEVIVNPTGKAKDGIVVYSQRNNTHLKYDKDESVKLVIDSAGEYEANDVFITGEKVKGEDTTVFVISGDEINIGVVCFVNKIDGLPEDLFEGSGIDILILNAGGGALYTPKQSENIYQRLSPKMAILFGFQDQANADRVDLVSIEEAKKDIEAMKPIEKTLKITFEELRPIENTEVFYFEL